MSLFKDQNGISKPILLSIIGGLIVLLGGGGWFYYEYVYWGANQTFDRTKAQVIDLESSHLSADLNASSNGVGVEAKLEGDWAELNSTAPKVKGVLDLTVKQEGLNISAKGEVRLVDNEFFVNISELPAVLTGFEGLKNQWIRFSKETLGEFTQTDLAEKCTLTEAQQEELKQSALTEEIFTDKTKVGRETVQNQSVRKYTAKLNKAAFIALLKKSNNLLPEECRTSEEEIDKTFENVSDIDVILWIGNDFISANLKFKIDSNDTKTDIDLTLTVTKLNQLVTVDKPEGAKDWEEVFGSLFGGGFSTLPDGDSGTSELEEFTPPALPEDQQLEIVPN